MSCHVSFSSKISWKPDHSCLLYSQGTVQPTVHALSFSCLGCGNALHDGVRQSSLQLWMLGCLLATKTMNISLSILSNLLWLPFTDFSLFKTVHSKAPNHMEKVSTPRTVCVWVSTQICEWSPVVIPISQPVTRPLPLETQHVEEFTYCLYQCLTWHFHSPLEIDDLFILIVLCISILFISVKKCFINKDYYYNY